MYSIIYTLLLTHITIISVTLYLHRSQAHKSVTFHPIVNHFFRFWLWLTTGMRTNEWVAIHRRHHQKTDLPGDPHSPKNEGLLRVLFLGSYLYHIASKDKQMVTDLSKDSPKDYIERKLYQPYTWLGVVLMLLINIVIFGYIGILVWLVQMIWIPFFAAGVVNGIGHYWGYRTNLNNDSSRNILPLGIVIGGEELHHNHHLSPTSAKLSKKWFELDIGWLYIKLLSFVKLAYVR